MKRPRSRTQKDATTNSPNHEGLPVSRVSDLLHIQVGDAGQVSEVSIRMENCKPVANRAGGNHAIHAGSYRITLAPRRSIKLNGIQENILAHRGLHNRKGKHGFPGDAESAFVLKSLEDFLNDGKAGDHRFQFNHRLDLKRFFFSKRLDPDRTIDEVHAGMPFGFPQPGLLSFRKDSLPRGRFRSIQGFDAP